jgi:drug/metabolite transporter (DMT)-like permease
MSDKYLWLLYVALAGLSWGTYVPLIFYGGSELVPSRPGSIGPRMMAVLCVGLAYFLIGVVVPLIMFFSGQTEWPKVTTTGLVFSSLAGAAGAIGAICVIFATKSAIESARGQGLDPSTYKLYIAPLIFGLAPVINTVVAMLWHPEKDAPFHFGFTMPGWKLWLGIILVGLGAALVLYSKEESEATKHAAKPAPTGTTSTPTPLAAPEPVKESKG